MSRARCLEALSDVKDTIKEMEADITNYRFKEARGKLLMTLLELVDDLDDELTDAGKITHHIPDKNPHCHPLPSFLGDKKK